MAFSQNRCLDKIKGGSIYFRNVFSPVDATSELFVCLYLQTPAVNAKACIYTRVFPKVKTP